ncbi:Uncharacterised protein [Slackia heliotrinireducens]|uniref:Phage protein n=1 Tax=Slackia heliotrinireducens (strain ATCC 29202 / DSM 20476 / NCTC 11029 / RHS 1) TaxID=471855 RepID=C7N6R7_SLAHD|nr:hypothetical protein [Slackia heliotrinireducens]ACV22602.1 hypothetical protein Shel_15830 [Slackia heliotrinireducens DSM 20476]VEH01115.1 Uncharacterised protein [Slackia heliotrinireducens]
MNNMGTLNDALFRELERLESAEGDGLQREVERAKAVADLAGKVIDNARTSLQAVRLQREAEDGVAASVSVPRFLMGE